MHYATEKGAIKRWMHGQTIMAKLSQSVVKDEKYDSGWKMQPQIIEL